RLVQMQCARAHDVLPARAAQAQPMLFDSVNVRWPLIQQRDVNPTSRKHAADDGADCASSHDSNASRHVASVACTETWRVTRRTCSNHCGCCSLRLATWTSQPVPSDCRAAASTSTTRAPKCTSHGCEGSPC